MGDPVEFIARAELKASSNLLEFIQFARVNLTAFSGGGGWEDDRWQHGKTVVLFSAKSDTVNSYSFTPLAEPFKQFAKAYVRYVYSLKPVRCMAATLRALRCIEAVLLDSCGRAEIGLLNGALMDVCADRCRAFYDSGVARFHTGRHLEAIFDFVRKKLIVPVLPAWRSPFKMPADLTEDVGPAGQAHRDSKLPSNTTMLMVADLFAQADDPESRYFSSILILLMATPSRISEVLRLPVDCLQWELDGRGEPQMYLRWHAAKGKGATKKWIVPAMRDVVKEAIRRLHDIGEPAREAARFAFNNPGRFMGHEGCLDSENIDIERPLTPEEFCAAVGVKCRGPGRLIDGTPTWSQVVVEDGLKVLIDRRTTSYGDLARYVLETYDGLYWPHIDEQATVCTWDALCLHRQHEFHKDFSVKYFSWRLPTANEINSRLASKHGRSLFDQRGFKNPDSTSIKLTTHQLRHWLSTMSERAGMDDYTLAQWAGRARVADNRHYDHRSPEERLEASKEVLQIERPSLLERIKHRHPVTYQELGVDRLGTAKATLYGMCVHDYAMAPCQKQRECMTCKEHVCVKGDHVSLERIRLLEDQTADLLQKAQHAHDDGVFGADRWADNHKWKLAHVRAMRMALEHPKVAEGAVLQIPDGHDPSVVRRALIDLGLERVPSVEEVGPKVIPVALG